VQLESVTRHTSSYTTPMAASAVDRCGAGRRRSVGLQDGEPAPGHGMVRSTGRAESKRATDEAGLGCE
jgi:hypothetical protein